MRPEELAVAFVACRPDLLPSATLGEQLAAGLLAGRVRWPGVDLDDFRFVKHVASKVAGDVDDAVAALKLGDLYLAAACIHRVTEAIETFDRRMLAQVPAFVARYVTTTEEIDELKQRLRVKLLVGERGMHPRIAQYSGRGTLASWLCAAAVRTALDASRATVPTESLDAESVLADADVELAYLRKQYAAQFCDAIREAIAGLPTRDRNLMRFYYLERLTLDALAQLHGVHATTVMRWLADVRATILAATRRSLRARLQIGESEIDSLWHALRSQLDVSVRALLEAEP